LKPGTIIKPGDYVQESALAECRRENRELLARMRKMEAVAEAAKDLIVALVVIGPDDAVNYHINKTRDAINDWEKVNQ